MEYELLEHTGDLKIRVKGKGFDQLLKNAAFALCDLMLPLDRPIEETCEISIEGISREQVLVRFLNELIYIIQTQFLLFRDFDIEEVNNGVNAICRGYRLKDSDRPDYDIKGATYHDLVIENIDDNFTAQFILDI